VLDEGLRDSLEEGRCLPLPGT